MSKFRTDGYTPFGDSVRYLTVLLIIGSLTLFASNIIAGQLFSSKSIGSRGTIKKINVGIYWDENCSSTVSFIDWGTIEPGSIKNVSVFIRNEGTHAASLFLSTDNWNPSNASWFITLGWDYDGQTFEPFEILLVTLILQVSPDIEGIKSFSFDIIIGVTA
jgi:hypothetical protein